MKIDINKKTLNLETTDSDMKVDKALNIETTRSETRMDKLKIYNRYEPTPYEDLHLLISNYKVTEKDHVVDFGSGKGRVSFFLNYFCNSGCTSVEIVEEFHKKALSNYAGYCKKNKIKPTNMFYVNGCAEDYVISDFENKFYFFNPFSLKIFINVVNRIIDSFEKNNRTIDIIMYYPDYDYIDYLDKKTIFKHVMDIDTKNIVKNPREKFSIYRLDKDLIEEAFNLSWSDDVGEFNLCMPITKDCECDILEEVKKLDVLDIDMIEWRADYYKWKFDSNKVISLLKHIKKYTSKKIIFTLRTSLEGGLADISIQDYNNICKNVLESNFVDYIDIEVYREKDYITELIYLAKKKGVKTIGSYHNFELTPSSKVISSILEYISKTGVDVVKVAFMPEKEGDVIRLDNVIKKFKSAKRKQKIVAISMSELGKRTRIDAKKMGCFLTFLSNFSKSAPGQITLEEYNNKQNS